MASKCGNPWCITIRLYCNLFVNKSDLTSDDTVMCHGFSIAAYERRQLGQIVVVVKASFQWSRFGNDSPLAETAEAALQIEQIVGKWADIE